MPEAALPVPDPGPDGAAVPIPGRSRLAAYVALTKPRIIELLLVTTVPAMIVAERGMPPAWLILARWRRHFSWTKKSHSNTCSTPS